MPSYAILFLLFAVVAIAAYFYLMRAKARNATKGPTTTTSGAPRSPANPFE